MGRFFLTCWLLMIALGPLMVFEQAPFRSIWWLSPVLLGASGFAICMAWCVATGRWSDTPEKEP